ncbi:MAG: L,D-transpeptidase family protein [Actinomycetota bacterium]
MSPRRMLASTAAAAQLLAVVAATGVFPASAGTLPPSEWVVGPDQRVAFIVLDGHPGDRGLRDVRLTLKNKAANASFFFSGHWVDHHRRQARRIVDAGHGLGNRGYGKEALFTSLSDEALRASISKAEAALRRVGAHGRPFLRAPKGVRDLRVLRVAGSMGYRSVRWTQHPGQGRSKKMQRKAVRTAQPGSIISLDIWRPSNRNALGGIIDGLRRRGFKLRTMRLLDNSHAVRWDVTLRSGSQGAEVYHLQRTLNSISFPAAQPDGNFGYATLQAVYAFEKFHELARDGVVTPRQMTMIETATRPSRPRPGKTYIDIDISRQVLREVRRGRVFRTLPISSGNEEYYTVDGETYKAHTPRGDFVIERKIAGWRESRLGKLWYPNYFVGGFAIHGSESVPTYPASHGCVRIPMYATRGFYDRNPIGTPVYVHN